MLPSRKKVDTSSLYKISIWSSRHTKPPRVRYVRRDTPADAVDSAKRELRRIRRTDPDGLHFDRWELRRHTFPVSFQPKLAEGTAEGL